MSESSANNEGLGGFDPVPQPGQNLSLSKRHTLKGSELLD